MATLGQFLCLFCLCFLVISCSNRPVSGPTTSTPSGGSDRLSVGTTETPTLDPADGYEVGTSNIITSLGDRLYSYQARYLDSHNLPKNFPKCKDGLKYTILCVITFHDGTPFNAGDDVFPNRFSENGGNPRRYCPTLWNQ